MNAKEKHRLRILEYLSDPTNEELDRTYLATNVCGFSGTSMLCEHLKSDELDEIYAEALEVRRKRYAQNLLQIDRALFQSAAKGNPQSIKLIYQRFEGWVEKKEQKHTGDLTVRRVFEGEAEEE